MGIDEFGVDAGVASVWMSRSKLGCEVATYEVRLRGCNHSQRIAAAPDHSLSGRTKQQNSRQGRCVARAFIHN